MMERPPPPATGITTRAYAGLTDLLSMQAAASAAFGRGVDHVGDLAWATRGQMHAELSALVTLVESEGRLLGWTWCHSNGSFDAVAALDENGVEETLVQAALQTVQRCVQYGDNFDKLSVLCAEDDHALADALRGHGFAPLDETFEVTRRSLDDLPKPALPEEFEFAYVEDALVDERVEAHRAAFAPSRLTGGAYARVRRAWPYRAGLDRVVLAPDGRVAASCLGWLDADNGWGLLEPVGTRPEFRRRGLAAAVCLDALHRLREAGAHSAQVSCESGSAGSATYHSIGFETVRRMLVFGRLMG
jgi:ribosomal protein S18 acetylase RimI-like enzyme